MPEVMSIEVDEEFDPRPQQSPFGLRDPEGNLNIGMIAGIVIAIFLVLMLIFVVVKPFGSDKPVATSNWKPKDPTVELTTLESYPVNSAIVRSTQSSLEAWAKFYTSGDLEGLVSTFDLAGAQYALLVQEAPKVSAAPDPGEPAVVKLGPVGKVSQTDNIYVIRVVVNWTKPGQAGSEFKWDITLERKDSSRYLLSSVKDTDPAAKQPIDFCTAAGLVSELDDADTLGEEYRKFPESEQLSVVSNAFAIRLKAWSYLYEVAQGTSDEQDVAAIVSEYETLVKNSSQVATVAELLESAGRVDISKSRASIEERVQGQCDLDVSNR